MTSPRPSVRVPIVSLPPVAPPAWNAPRRAEPVTLGVPLPEGAVRPDGGLVLETTDARRVPGQMRALDLWPDGSVRWALCDVRVDAENGRAAASALTFGPSLPVAPALTFEASGDRVAVDTGRARFTFAVGGAFPCPEVRLAARADLALGAALSVSTGGEPLRAEISRIVDWHAGPLRGEVRVDGVLLPARSAPSIRLQARIELFAGSGTARIAVTIRNAARAEHQGGQWGLGDAGSMHIESASLDMPLPEAVERIRWTAEPGAPLVEAATPFVIHQASSGGSAWRSPVHRNARGAVVLPFKGYEWTAAGERRQGLRALPVLRVHTGGIDVDVAVPEFWQQFPRAIAVDGTRLEVGLCPRQSPEPEELQGGEQKTHLVVVAFGGDAVTAPPLAWCHEPIQIGPTAAWSCATGAVPYLLPAADDPAPAYQALVDEGLGSDGFDAKRERADEFGWRDFGDLPADHESAFRPPDEPFVSHYNNQYDAIAGFGQQYLRTADRRWRQLMDELARHVRDIDIYHTTDDKAAYNGGLFWHTAHYSDAGLSTHRTYAPGGPASGGPSAEHNYNAGLMWHYFLTGDPASRDAAIGLGQWVVDMDDGARTAFRWAAGGPTGLASFSADYYGPGRGAGHSILALLVAHRLTGERRYLEKADELVRRTVHPADDVAARDLLDAERRWSYTAFLQALGVYLDHRRERGLEDGMFAYAQASLLHYARWMLANERPYLDDPDRLEYPTETWAAQDMRKAEVFLWAALYGPAAERDAFLARARFFFHYSVDTLSRMPTHVFTRPTVLLLSFGARQSWFERHARELPVFAQPQDGFGPVPVPFEPQKARAIRRAGRLAVAGAAGLLAAALGWWAWR